VVSQYPGYGRDLQARVDRAIELIGEASLDDGAWPAAFESVRDVLGADSALLFTPTLSSQDPASLWLGKALDGESIARYQAHYHTVDTWVHEIAQRRIASDRIILGDDVLPTSELKRSEWYNDFLHGYDILYLMGARLIRPDQSFAPVYASFYRSPRSEPFGGLEARLYAHLVPHIRRSMEVRGRLSASRIHGADATAALDALAHPIFLLDRTGRVLFMNRSAVREARKQGGIRIRDGRLVLVHHEDNQALDQAIARVATGRPAAVETIAIRRSEAASEIILVAPLPRASGVKASAIVIVGDRGGRNRNRSAEFARIYGLTPTEIRLVEQLSAGLSIQDIAMDRQVAVDTVNKQVKKIMAKNGCHRQVDIVRHFLCFPIMHDDELSR
jgi:DNA-binding CsgD family transcriptional regulator/PAS domain-containing protein